MTTMDHEICPGVVIKIDADDLPRIAEHRWNTKPYVGAGGQYYQIVQRGEGALSLLRYIVGCHPQQRVLRRNGNPLDYTRGNLFAVNIKRVGAKKSESGRTAAIRTPAYARRLLARVDPRAAACVCTERQAIERIMRYSDRDWMILLGRAA